MRTLGCSDRPPSRQLTQVIVLECKDAIALLLGFNLGVNSLLLSQVVESIAIIVFGLSF
jgi:hypothetical protein